MGATGALFVYNGGMGYVEPIIDSFWEVATQLAQVATPVIGVYLIFSLVKRVLR